MDRRKPLPRGELIASRCFADAALRGERGQRLADMGRANAAGVAELDKGQGTIGVGEYLLEFVDRGGRRPRRGGHRIEDLQGERVADAAEGERETRLRGGGTMLAAEEQAIIDSLLPRAAPLL